jgi:hypothetical protein
MLLRLGSKRRMEKGGLVWMIDGVVASMGLVLTFNSKTHAQGKELRSIPNVCCG